MNLTDYRDITALLQRYGFRFSKSMGQNFLTAAWVPEDIAASAGVSQRECLRCFRKNVGCTPFEYLNTYRIQQAAIQLIQTDRSILDIAVSCGFSTGSYFGKKFREVMHCTPREYRERHR